jgi:hypothetical protein
MQRDYLVDLDIDGKIILKRILEMWHVDVNWIRLT